MPLRNITKFQAPILRYSTIYRVIQRLITHTRVIQKMPLPLRNITKWPQPLRAPSCASWFDNNRPPHPGFPCPDPGQSSLKKISPQSRLNPAIVDQLHGLKIFANSLAKWFYPTMRPRRNKVAVGLVLLLAIVVLWLSRSVWLRTEPVYQGKALTSWVGQWRTNHWRGDTDAEAKKVSLEAEQAILSMKDEAIPFLLDLMRGQEPSWKKKLRSLTFGQWRGRLQLEDRTSKLKNLGAVGLAALGTNAAPAVPSLIELASIEMNRTPPIKKTLICRCSL
jgi:hypothetical protein